MFLSLFGSYPGHPFSGCVESKAAEVAPTNQPTKKLSYKSQSKQKDILYIQNIIKESHTKINKWLKFCVNDYKTAASSITQRDYFLNILEEEETRV